MNIVSWNVNGLRAIHRKNLFLPALETLKPDIVCLQETKAQQHQSEVDLPEYDEYWNSAERPGYSGTAIFSKMKPLSISLNFPEAIVSKYKLGKDGYGNPNAEGRVITAEYNDFFLVNVYTPNSKPDLSRLSLRYKYWDPGFLAFCKQLEKRKPVIFCGDLNVAHTEDDLANPKQNEGGHGFTKEERAGVDAMLKAGFIDTFRLFTQGKGHYTWWTPFANARARNIGWRIDYFFVSAALVPRITAARIHANLLGSDHCPTSLSINVS